jgi:RNA-directed DNA polymerase
VRPPESQATTATQLTRIAQLSARDPQKTFDSLMHHFNETSLKECFHQLDGTKAVGVDGVTKAVYARDLEDNLTDLVARMKRMAYRPDPVRQVLIPKAGTPHATRPLGLSNLEDKVVQLMMHRVLESIYEPLFLDCSYGFRPGRGCHEALRALHQHLYRKEVETIIDLDIANYFGTIDHGLLEAMLREKIQDERFMRYTKRMFKAGVLTAGELTVSEEGVPQGSCCSPILANIFAHHVLDTWFEEVVKPHCRGQVALYRYADDAVICCQYARDAERILRALRQRLAKYRLRLHEEKTQLVSFSKQAGRQGELPGTFEFLGLLFYWGRSRKGAVIPKVKTSGKRFRSKLQRVKEWARARKDKERLTTLWATFCAKLRGHIQYYGVSFNLAHVRRFLHRAPRILWKWLNRRSQRRSMNWDQFHRFLQRHPLPRAKIYHALF